MPLVCAFQPVADTNSPCFHYREWLESVARGRRDTVRLEERKCQKYLDTMVCHEARTHALKSEFTPAGNSQRYHRNPESVGRAQEGWEERRPRVLGEET